MLGCFLGSTTGLTGLWCALVFLARVEPGSWEHSSQVPLSWQALGQYTPTLVLPPIAQYEMYCCWSEQLDKLPGGGRVKAAWP